MSDTQPQFEDLTAVPTQAQILDTEVLPQLATQPGSLQVTSWPLNGVYRSLAMILAFLRLQARVVIAAFCAAGFEDYVFGRTPAPGGIDVTGWAPLVAKQRYGIVQKPATYTLRTITLTNASATPYNNLVPGSIILQFPSGNRYFLRGGQAILAAAAAAGDTSLTVASTSGFPSTGTLLVDKEQITYTGVTSSSFTGLTRGANGTTAAAHLLAATVAQVISIPAAVSGVPGVTQATFRSERLMAPGLTYNTDLPNSALQLVTASFAGVTASNPSTPFSAVSQAGSGIGVVTPTGTPIGGNQVTILITASGTVAAGSVGWSTSVNGGTFVQQSGSSVANLSGTGINIALGDNGGSFVKGTYYFFSSPGSDITQTGVAIESVQSLGQRCAGMWALIPSLFDLNGNYVPPASPTVAAYITMALLNPNVVIAFVQNDPVINNLLHIYLAGQGGAMLPIAVIAQSQAFFQGFNMVTDQVVCQTPTGSPINLAGLTISVRTALYLSARQAMQQRIAAYLGGTDAVQPLGINGLIDYDYILSLIRTTPGITHVSGTLTINGSSTDLQLPVTPGAVEVAQWADAWPVFTWVTT